MTLLDINQDNNILDELVITKFDILIPLLRIVSNNKNINNNDLRKESKFSGGKIYHSVKALKAQRLVENGNGLRITDLGKRFLLTYNSDKNEFQHALKESCLNVPLFKKIYEENKELKDAVVLYKLFETEISNNYNGIDKKLIGSAVRRYLKGIHNKKVRIGAKLYDKEKLDNQIDNKIKNSDDIIDSLANLKKNLNLSQKELQAMINSLPEEKREDLISRIFSKVF